MTRLLRGRCLPFERDEAVIVDGKAEAFAASSFVAWLWDRPTVALTLYDHASAAILDGVEVFADRDFGVGFEVELTDAAGSQVSAAVVNGGMDYCSVGGLVIDRSERAIDANGGPVNRVTRARFDHITITNDPAYRMTAAWVVGIPGEMPPRIAALAARWTGAKARADRVSAIVAEIKATGAKHRAAAAEAHALPVMRALAARQSDFARFRDRWAMAMVRGQIDPRLVVGHAAFAKPFFDGNFGRLLADARRRIG